MAGTRVAARRYMKAAIRRPALSKVVTTVARPWARHLPAAVLDRIPPVGSFTVTLPGTDAVLRLQSEADDTQAAGAFWYGIAAAEPETYRWLWALGSQSSVFLDVGANIGLYTLSLAARHPSLRVVAFEPVPRVAEALRRNVSLNGLANVTVCSAAVSDRNGTDLLYVPPGGVPLEATLLEGLRIGTTPVEVTAVTIDKAVNDLELPVVDLVKIDVEGCELAVLQGAARTIADHHPTIVCEVLHGVGTGTAIADYLRPLGYDFFSLTAGGGRREPLLQGDPSFKELNYLLVHESRLPDVGSIVPLASFN
jgi:FkbM family methyltransferase